MISWENMAKISLAFASWEETRSRKASTSWLNTCTKMAWYSGRIRIPSVVNKSDFDYIKLGPYIAHLGSLKQPTTNQRLYKKVAGGQFNDITSRFWKR